MTIENFREKFNSFYFTEIEKILKDFNSYSENKEIRKLTEKVKKISFDGKRIRPYVLSLAYEIKKGTDFKKIKNQLIAVELLHLFALIHDDLMDNSILRHGIPTINSFGKKETEIQKAKNEAVIIGDYIFAASYKYFLKNNTSLKSIDYFQTLIDEVVFGQTLDLELSQDTKYNQQDVLKKMLYKTARYTFTRPIQIGILLRDEKAKEKQLKTAEKFGDSLGVLFQIDDDLLDIFGDPKNTKKNTFQDIESKQATLLVSYLLENKKYKKIITSFLGKKINSEEQNYFKKSLLDSGALEKINKKREEMIMDCNKNIIGSEKYQIIWKALVEKISNRNK